MRRSSISISPLAPDSFPKMPRIAGIELSTAASGTRYKGRDDLLLIKLKPQSSVAGVFTLSDTAAAPVCWSRNIVKNGSVRAIITNAGNANAFTGCSGTSSVNETVEELAKLLNCSKKEILVASTGVIGEPLDVKKLSPMFAKLTKETNATWKQAAEAIITTDTFPKGATATCKVDDVTITICGIAKGSGMIAPNMATMLGYIATDINLPANVLSECLNEACQLSFNSISVDGDTSTNDSVFLLASASADNIGIDRAEDPKLSDFRAKLRDVMQDLAIQIVRDGEGASKLVTIDIAGADNELNARKIGLSIANSPLVKTAVFGEDPNWGRIVMAIGKVGLGIDPRDISIKIGGYPVASSGKRVAGYDEEIIAEHMAGKLINIKISVGEGSGTSTIWTCDLTHQYISINADYRS